MWSFGCVLAELLFVISNAGNNNTKRVLFPGKFCFPLSPKMSQNSSTISKKDQLKVIINVLGHLNEEDISFVTDDEALEYLQISNKDQLEKNLLSSMYPNVSKKLIELLKGLLEFNPNMRLTAEEALKNPIFDKIRVPFYEKQNA
jgi:serine/threonine protein kinase